MKTQILLNVHQTEVRRNTKTEQKCYKVTFLSLSDEEIAYDKIAFKNTTYTTQFKFGKKDCDSPSSTPAIPTTQSRKLPASPNGNSCLSRPIDEGPWEWHLLEACWSGFTFSRAAVGDTTCLHNSDSAKNFFFLFFLGGGELLIRNFTCSTIPAPRAFAVRKRFGWNFKLIRA